MGIEAINSRIADIRSRIIGLQTLGQVQSVSAVSQSVQSPPAAGESFAGYLQSAVAADAKPTSTAASRRADQLTSAGVPVELASFGNGRIPAGALEQIGTTSHRLWAPAAESLTRMIADARQQGVHIGITDSYRPFSEQVDLARRKGLYSQGGLAAKPGTSEHGWGMAADLALDAPALSWMRQNGEKYGFVNDVSRESWHWAYRPPAGGPAPRS